MKHHPVWLACACAAILFALTGCPGQHKPQLILPQQPDQYDQWAQGLQQEDAFYAELQRLQRLYADAPDLALAVPQAFDGQYTLKSRIEKQRAGLTLTDRNSSDQWTLWFLDGTGKDAPQIETTRDEASAGGYSIEVSLGGKVSVTLVARWVQGRYLQLTRELTLNGMDQTAQAKAQYTEWTLDGPWLPYRMAPGLSGPYGVVPDSEADGAWHSRLYPVEAMVPAVAAYDRTHGFMLAVSDDHPRKLDRRYGLGYAIPKGLAPGAQIRCTYTSYDGTRDAFDRPWMASGLPLRDSVVLEPLKLVCKSTDPTLVEAESAEVIQHMADFVHAYHFVPKPPKQPEPGAIVRVGELPMLAEIYGAGRTTVDGVQQAAGPCGAKLCLFQLGDSALNTQLSAGIDGDGLTGAKGLSADDQILLQSITQYGLAPLIINSPFRMKQDTALVQAKYGWFYDDSGHVIQAPAKASPNKTATDATPTAQSNLAFPDLRNPQAVAWLVRKPANDISRFHQVAGYCFEGAPDVARPRTAAATPYISSPDALGAAVQLRMAEAIRTARSNAVLLSDAQPNLGFPACTSLMIPPASGATGTFAPDTRLAALILSRVFDVSPYIDSVPNLSDTVLRVVGDLEGLGLYPVQDAPAGFPEFATHQYELQAASGELRVVYSDPAKNAYTGGDERPAVCGKLIAILPGKWEGAQSLWVCFSGIGGSLRVDKYNYLSISWEGGGWTGKLPTGYWEIEHPSKGEDIKPGDAVLIQLKPIAPLLTPGKPLG